MVIIAEGMVVLDLTLQVKKITSPAISINGVNLLMQVFLVNSIFSNWKSVARKTYSFADSNLKPESYPSGQWYVTFKVNFTVE